jgi:hypothetical protein
MIDQENIDDIPELRLDRTKITVVTGFDDFDEIEYWRNTAIGGYVVLIHGFGDLADIER